MMITKDMITVLNDMLLRGIENDDASPNVVADAAYTLNIQLTDQEVVHISCIYDNKGGIS
jgi:hypothetical protein